MANEQRPSKLSKEWTTVLVILGAAFLYKIVYLTFYAQQMPYYLHAEGDSAIYLDWAQRIIHGDFWGLQPDFRVFYRAPLYPYLLAVSLKIFGNSMLPVYIVQFLLGTFNLYLVYVIARRFFSHRAGLIAIVLAALYAPLTFKESKLESVTLVMTLLLVGAWLLIKAQASKPKPQTGEAGVQGHAGPKRRGITPTAAWFLAGICFGLATTAWGGALAMVLVLIGFWLFPAMRRAMPEPKRAFRYLVLLLVGGFLMVLPATLHNLLVGNDLVLVNSNNGYTFYQGNDAGASGTIVTPPEVYEQAYGGRFPVGITDQQAFDLGYASGKLYPPQQGQPRHFAKPSEASGFWLKRGLSWIAKNPGQFLRLEFQKLELTLSNYEFPSNYYLNVELNEVPVLRVLFMPFALIFALGIVGIFLTAPRTRDAQSRFLETWPLHLITIATVLTLMVFYVGSRYRLPMMLPLAVFAGGGADAMLGRWQKKQTAFAEVGVAVVALVVSWVLCAVPLKGRMDFTTALGYRNLGENYQDQGANPVQAERAYNRGLAIFDANAGFGHTTLSASAESDLLTLRGNALMNQQKYDSAFGDFHRALATDPRMSDPLSRLALGYYTEAIGKGGQDRPAWRHALLDSALSYGSQYWQTDSTSIPANALIGDIQVARGDTDAALLGYQNVTVLDSTQVGAWVAIAGLLAGRGRISEAVEDLNRAWGIDTFDMVAPLALGNIYGTQGDNARANQTFAKAVNRVERNPRNIQGVMTSQLAGEYLNLKYFLGISCLNLEDWSGAAEQAQELLKLAPNLPEAKQLLQDAQNHVKPK